MIAATRFGTSDVAAIMSAGNAATATAFGGRAPRDDRADAAAALAAATAGGAAFKPSPLPRSAEAESPQGAREPTGDSAIGGAEPGATGSYSRWWSPEVTYCRRIPARVIVPPHFLARGAPFPRTVTSPHFRALLNLTTLFEPYFLKRLLLTAFPFTLSLSPVSPLLLPTLPSAPSPAQEDLILLDHVRSYGTRHWGVLKASGRLPHRDNKACCNRFILLKKRYLDQEGAPVYHGLTEPLSQGLTPALRSAHSQSELSILSPTSPQGTSATATTTLSSPAAITSHQSFAHPHHPRGYLVTSSHAGPAAAAAPPPAAASTVAAAAGAIPGQPRGLPVPVGSDPGPTAEPAAVAGGSSVQAGLSAAFSKAPEAVEEEELRGLALTAGGKWEEREGGVGHGGMAHGGMAHGGLAHGRLAHRGLAHGGMMDGEGMEGAMVDAMWEAYHAGGGMMHGEAMVGGAMMDEGMGIAGLGAAGMGMAGLQSTQQGTEGTHAAARGMGMTGSHAGAGSMGRGGAHGGGVGAHAWAVERAIREGLRPHASTSFKIAARRKMTPHSPSFSGSPHSHDPAFIRRMADFFRLPMPPPAAAAAIAAAASGAAATSAATTSASSGPNSPEISPGGAPESRAALEGKDATSGEHPQQEQQQQEQQRQEEEQAMKAATNLDRLQINSGNDPQKSHRIQQSHHSQPLHTPVVTAKTNLSSQLPSGSSAAALPVPSSVQNELTTRLFDALSQSPPSMEELSAARKMSHALQAAAGAANHGSPGSLGPERHHATGPNNAAEPEYGGRGHAATASNADEPSHAAESWLVPPTVHSHSAARGKVGKRTGAGGSAGVAAGVATAPTAPGGVTDRAGMQSAAVGAAAAGPKDYSLNKMEKSMDEQDDVKDEKDEKAHTPEVEGGGVAGGGVAGGGVAGGGVASEGRAGAVEQHLDEDMCTMVRRAGEEGQGGGDAERAAEAAWQGGDDAMMQTAWWNAADAVAAVVAAAGEEGDAWMPFDFCPDPSTPPTLAG
ncbi:unnamed protein product [Closterium sp. NIES-65]|nr:unnamed protein product [Closterium sp. NIES-65]